MPAKREDREPLIPVLSLKGTAEWRDWLQDAANALEVSSAQLIDLALVELVKKKGLPQPPKRTG